jgi:hypothetical protein
MSIVLGKNIFSIVCEKSKQKEPKVQSSRKTTAWRPGSITIRWESYRRTLL